MQQEQEMNKRYFGATMGMTRFGQSIRPSVELLQTSSLTSKKIKVTEEEGMIFFMGVKTTTNSFMVILLLASWTMWEEMISSKDMEAEIRCGEGQAMISFTLDQEAIQSMVVLVTI